MHLYIMLIRRIIRRQRTYFQPRTGNVFLVDEVVTRITAEDVTEDRHVVALVDADLKVSEPNPVLYSSDRIQIILATSPKEHHTRS